MTDKNKLKKSLSPFIFLACALLMGAVLYTFQPSSTYCPFALNKKLPAPAASVNNEANTVKLPTLIEFGSKNCNACKMMKPIIDNLTKEYAGIIKVKFIDVWLKENADTGEKYNISSIPTQIFFNANSKELWRHNGYLAKKDILKKWKELGYDLPALKEAKTVKISK